VVWLSDSGPEYGTVRWLGVLPGASPHTMAGVEFVSFFILLFGNKITKIIVYFIVTKG